MAVENISWSISTIECCRPRGGGWGGGLNPRPPGLQSDGASNRGRRGIIVSVPDHYLPFYFVVSKLNLRIQPAWRPQGKKVPKRLDVSKLKQDSKRQAFINDICSRLDAMELTSDDPEENWKVFRDTVHSSAMDSLGSISHKHRDWFDENDEEIQGLLEEKYEKHKTYLSDTTQYPIRRHIQIYARQSTLGSEICKTPGWAVRLMKSSSLQVERI